MIKNIQVGSTIVARLHDGRVSQRPNAVMLQFEQPVIFVEE
jgi:hypothetical protein